MFTKLDCPWVGPCYVMKRLGESVYRVPMRLGGQTVVLNLDRIALYLGERQLFKSRGQRQTAGATHHADGGAEHAVPDKG